MAKKILLAEDDQALATMYKIKFETDGLEVTAVDNGADALKLAPSGDFDLILLDVIMPQLDGFSTLKELKENAKTKKIPVVMLTNLGTDEDRQKGTDMGALDYLVKASLTPEQLSTKVKQYLK